MLSNFKLASFLCFFSFVQNSAYSQCTINSTSGYQVSVSICPQSVVVSTNNCPDGYNYNLNFNYNIVMTGAVQELYTLQTIMYCNGGQQLGYYALPKLGGSGSAVTTTNPWINVDGPQYNYTTHPDCNSATVQNLHCLTLQVIIQGPGIPYQTINCNCTTLALPVSFLGFEVEKNSGSNYLTWETESETRNKFFTIEVSEDAQTWSKIADVQAVGNSLEKQTYSYEDFKNIDNSVYYKLSQTDEDGTRNELSLVHVNRVENEFSVYPNPLTSNELNIQFPENFRQNSQVRFYDELGLLAEELNIAGGVIQEENLQVSKVSLAKGIYLVEIRSETQDHYRTRLVVQ